MAKYKRIKGGEKTAKSGMVWSRTELSKILELYLHIEGKGIHENNPQIHTLSKALGRSIRSTEAQLLMFRCLDRGGKYSHGNMNKICTELWDARISQSCSEEKVDDNMLFPNAFFSWSGSSDGAVKRPFERDVNRLVEPVSTKVTERIDSWLDSVVNKSSCPRSILLVGGPGNGKTDTVEYAVNRLGNLLGCHSEIEHYFYSEYSHYIDKGVLPRKVTLNKPIGIYDGLILVQDATVSDPDPNIKKNALELLLDDLENIVLNTDSNMLYLCCVNRGVLAEATPIAAANYQRTTINFLNKIPLAVSPSSDPIDAWPLKDYDNIAVWPMDMESLVDISLYEGKETPAEIIFKSISDSAKWKNHNNCSAKQYCPFATNQRLLSDMNMRSNLIEILHSYELASGKRWNFRELFGLISFLMVGSENGYKGITPCEWVQKQVKLATSSGKKKETFRASFNLVSKLYTHALFPRWPKLGSLRSQFAKKITISGSTFGGEREIIQGFFSALSTRKADNSSSISVLINSDFGEILDPIGYAGNKKIDALQHISLEQVEESFSNSISLGLELINDQLIGPEQLLFQYLKSGELYIDNSELFNKSNAKIARSIHIAMKIFAARLFKRSIGVRYKIYQNVTDIELYKKTLINKVELGKLRRQFERLLNRDLSFSASLITTFGQPEPSTTRNAILSSSRMSVQCIPMTHSESKPKGVVPFFKIRNKCIPLTFELFYALHHSSKGLSPASLPENIFALLDSTKSCVLGEIVRDSNLLNQLHINVGSFNEMIKYDDFSGFYVETTKEAKV